MKSQFEIIITNIYDKKQTYDTPPQGVGVAFKLRSCGVFLSQVDQEWKEEESQEANIQRSQQLLQQEK